MLYRGMQKCILPIVELCFWLHKLVKPESLWMRQDIEQLTTKAVLFSQWSLPLIGFMSSSMIHVLPQTQWKLPLCLVIHITGSSKLKYSINKINAEINWIMWHPSIVNHNLYGAFLLLWLPWFVDQVCFALCVLHFALFSVRPYDSSNLQRI